MGTWNDLPGVITLPDGRRLRGRGLRGRGLRGRGLRDVVLAGDEEPEFGLYLTATLHEEARWESRWVQWPDFRLPASRSDAIAALRDTYERSAAMRVEIACDGGTGRTGTAIAKMARFAGVPSHDAVAWSRENYRPGSAETPWQRRFARRVAIEALP